jgi:hypothetical protein
MIDKLTLPKLHDLIIKNNLDIKEYKYLTKSALISKIKKTDWFNSHYNNTIIPNKNTSKYIGGYKLTETEITEDKTIKEDFKPLKIEKEEPKNEVSSKKELSNENNEVEEEEITTNVSTDKKGNIIIITFIPKNKII